MGEIDAARLHAGSIVIDLVCPLLVREKYLDEYVAGGATAVGPTVAADDSCESAMEKIGMWYQRLARLPERLVHVTAADDVRRAKRERKLGVIFHFQNTQPFERNPDLVEVFYRAGLRVCQLTYNVKNFLGDGCDEDTDAGLSQFGKKVIAEMNRVGMVVDVTHTGHRTTMEAMEVSTAPVIFSHSNAYAVKASRRNLKDDQIKACAATGGVIGLNGFPAFVSEKPHPTLDDLVDHAQHIASLVGTDHLSIGLDYYEGQWPYSTDEQARAIYEEWTRTGRWRPGTYSPPPWKYPEGLEVPSRLGNLTAALARRGFTEADIRKIMGENLVRVFTEVWR